MFTELDLNNIKKIQGVYAIKCIPTGRFYIGSTNHIVRRINEHISWLRIGTYDNKDLQDDFNKYSDKFKYYLVTEVINDDDLRPMEKYFLAVYWDTKLLYNKELNAGGFKIGNTLGTKHRGRKFTTGHCALISKALSGNGNHFYGVKLTGELNGMYGKTHTDEARKKMSESRKGNNNPNSCYQKELKRQRQLIV